MLFVMNLLYFNLRGVYMINIRRADLRDLERIQELNNELFELELANFDKHLIKGWPLSEAGQEYFENAIRNDYVIVAEKDKRVVGYLLASENNIPYYDFKIVELCNMCVESSCIKQGVGNALYRVFERYFKSKGFNHFTVTASALNENAKAFYSKMGFEPANITFTKF